MAHYPPFNEGFNWGYFLGVLTSNGSLYSSGRGYYPVPPVYLKPIVNTFVFIPGTQGLFNDYDFPVPGITIYPISASPPGPYHANFSIQYASNFYQEKLIGMAVTFNAGNLTITSDAFTDAGQDFTYPDPMIAVPSYVVSYSLMVEVS